MRYSILPAEQIRKELGCTPEQFSIRLGYSHASYRIALERKYLTRRMASEIARRFKISLAEWNGK